MEIKNTLKISAPISPYNSDDPYPSHFAEYGKGGYRTVKTLLDRDLIPDDRRENGMSVYVEDEEMLYALKDGITNENWVEFNILLSGSEYAKLFISYNEPKNPTPEFAWLNLGNGSLYLRDPSNRYWDPVISRSVDGGEF